ncbi:hypothetical protein D3C84_806590 [compost metagenome]
MGEPAREGAGTSNMDVAGPAAFASRLAPTRASDVAHDPAAPGKRIDPLTAGEHVAEVRLIAEAALQADLRQAQVSVLDQQLGAGDALLANPLLRRAAGAGFEGTGEMAA